jgi:DNA primase
MSDKKVLLNALSKYLGEPTSKKADNSAFYCPFCKHHKKKLEVDISTGLWNCWVCKTSGYRVSSLLKKLNASYKELKVVYKIENYTPKSNSYSIDYLQLPNNYVSFSNSEDSFFVNRLKKYLLSRGLSEDDLIKYNIGYLDDSKYNTILIPSYDFEFNLNFYVTKDIITGRYNNPDYSKNQIIFDSFVDWDTDIILTEGVFDSFAFRRNAIPLLGKLLNNKLKEKILISSSQKFYIALDGGELDDILRISKYLLGIGKTPMFVNIPVGEDPSSLGRDKVWNYIESSQPITESDIYMYELKSKIS